MIRNANHLRSRGTCCLPAAPEMPAQKSRSLGFARDDRVNVEKGAAESRALSITALND